MKMPEHIFQYGGESKLETIFEETISDAIRPVITPMSNICIQEFTAMLWEHQTRIRKCEEVIELLMKDNASKTSKIEHLEDVIFGMQHDLPHVKKAQCVLKDTMVISKELGEISEEIDSEGTRFGVWREKIGKQVEQACKQVQILEDQRQGLEKQHNELRKQRQLLNLSPPSAMPSHTSQRRNSLPALPSYPFSLCPNSPPHTSSSKQPNNAHVAAQANNAHAATQARIIEQKAKMGQQQTRIQEQLGKIQESQRTMRRNSIAAPPSPTLAATPPSPFEHPAYYRCSPLDPPSPPMSEAPSPQRRMSIAEPLMLSTSSISPSASISLSSTSISSVSLASSTFLPSPLSSSATLVQAYPLTPASPSSSPPSSPTMASDHHHPFVISPYLNLEACNGSFH